MSKYVLILDKEEPIEELLKQNFPEHYQINGHAWGMRTHAFSTEMSEKLFPNLPISGTIKTPTHPHLEDSLCLAARFRRSNYPL